MANFTPSTGNTTIEVNSTTLDDSNSVSRGEVFGMFLTLSFCLLSQPSGSLIYRPWPILAWRLSPIACLAETVLIFIFFAKIFFCTFFDVLDGYSHRFEDIPAGWRRHLAKARAFSHDFKCQAHALACALLLVRADVGKEHPEAQAMSEKLSDSGLFDNDDENPDTREGGRGRLLGGNQDQQGERDIERDAGTSETPPTLPQTTLEQTSNPTNTAETATTSTQPTALTDTQETPPDIDLTLDSRSTQQAVALRRVFGASVFAHRELPVQAVTLLSITGVTVKLCVSSLPMPLATSAFFMLCSWLSVQALLFTFHSRRVQDTGIKAIAETTQDVSSVMEDIGDLTNNTALVTWMFVGIAITFPLGGIALYGNIPKRFDVPDPIILDYIALWILRALGTGIVLLSVWLVPDEKDPEKKSDPEEPQCGIPGKIIFTVLVVAAYCDILIWGEDDEETVSRTDLFISTSLLWLVNILAAAMLLPMFHAIGTPVLPACRYVAAVGQAIVFAGTAFSFVIWMYKYDATGTSQPDWIKWLG